MTESGSQAGIPAWVVDSCSDLTVVLDAEDKLMADCGDRVKAMNRPAERVVFSDTDLTKQGGLIKHSSSACRAALLRVAKNSVCSE